MRVLMMAVLFGLLGSSAAVAEECQVFPVCIPVPRDEILLKKTDKDVWVAMAKNGSTFYQANITVLPGTEVTSTGLEGLLQLAMAAQGTEQLHFRAWHWPNRGLWVEARLGWHKLDEEGKPSLVTFDRCEAQDGSMTLDLRAISGTPLYDKIDGLLGEERESLRTYFIALAIRLYESRLPCTDGRRFKFVPYRF